MSFTVGEVVREIPNKVMYTNAPHRVVVLGLKDSVSDIDRYTVEPLSGWANDMERPYMDSTVLERFDPLLEAVILANLKEQTK